MTALWLSMAALVSLVGSPLRTTTNTLPVPGAIGDDFSYVRQGFHYSLGLAGMLSIFAILYGVLALAGARYRGWMGYTHLAFSAGGALLILSPALFVALLADWSSDPLAAFRVWNGVSAIGYAMTLAGVAMFAVVLTDTWRRSKPRTKAPAALPPTHG